MNLTKKEKQKVCEHILKFYRWKGARMIFPATFEINAVIELGDLLKIIKFKKIK